MEPNEASARLPPAAEAATLQGELHGDRLIAGIWIAMALALARALLQGVVDFTADHETGAALAEHVLDHVVDATSRVWVIVPLLAILPRGRGGPTKLLRAAVAFGGSVALLAGWPGGELRYTPGIDSTRGLQGWVAIGTLALAIATLDRYATSPHRRMLGRTPAVRFLITTAVLIVGGGAVATLAYLLDRRRLNMEVQAIVLDLLAELPRAHATAGAGGRVPEVGSILAEKGALSASVNRPSLVMPVGAVVEFANLDLPPHSSLTFGVGIDRATAFPKTERDPELAFIVELDGHEQRRVTMRPRSRAADRSWFECQVELTTREAHTGTLTLRVSGSGDVLGSMRAGFGRPLIVRRQWRPRVATDPRRMNVVFVVIDSLRPDHLGCYGGTRPTSPQIDRLAAESLLYERAQAPSSWTWPSVASYFTGVWPPTHGVEDFDRCFLSDSLETIAERFAQRGCTTLGVSSSPFISYTKNFQQGFEEWREFQLDAAPRLGETFEDWVRRFGEYQFFAYVHFNDPHRPYNPPPRFGTLFASDADVKAMREEVFKLREERSSQSDPARAKGPVVAEEEARPKLSEEAISELYDGEIACVDYEIGRMRRALEDQRLLDRTIFVVTSSQGEVLGAGRPPPAGASLSADYLHVPLIVRDPRLSPRRVPGVVDLTRLEPTLLWITRTEAEGRDGRDGTGAAIEGELPESNPPLLLPPWSGTPSQVAFAHTARGLPPGGGKPREMISICRDDWRLTIEPDGTLVEFTATDPTRGAQGGVADDPAGAAARGELQAELLRWYAACRQGAVSRPFLRMDYDTRSLLRDFGEEK